VKLKIEVLVKIMKISGIVVWYNPDKECIANIETYIDSVEKLYIVDNSKNNNKYLLNEKIAKKVVYIPNYNNFGIAKSLNIGCELSIKENFDWVLTMDQDSSFITDSLKKMVVYLKKNKNKKLAILGPSHKISYNSREKIIYYKKNRLMTSGNLINLEIYSEIGGFANELFIDEVDHEMCYKILKNHFDIEQLRDVFLKHNIGRTKVFRIFKKEFMVYNHNPERKYYMVRNKLYIRSLYPEYSKDYGTQIIKEFLKVILFEEKKIKKLTCMLRGIKDRRKVKEMWYDICVHGNIQW
jgi:rhamnosyltransferase